MKIYLQYFSILIICLTFSCGDNSNPLENQSSTELTGKINDFFGNPVADVKITTEPVSEIILTDKNGNFSIKNIKSGNCKILAQKAGFKTETKSVVLQDKKTLDVNLILRNLITISGKVFEELTANGLGSVSIGVENISEKFVTSSDGSFQIADIPIGSIAFTFTKVGYSLKKETVFVDIKKTTGYDFRVFKLTPMDMIKIDAAVFMMGDSFGDGYINEKPVHSVSLSKYSISKYEVTQKVWSETMGNNPAKFWGEGMPVESISWNDAINFCNSRSFLEGLTQCYKFENGKVVCDFNANGYRLPTEAEWEFAARGGTLSKNFKFSGSASLNEVGWFYNISSNITHSVGLKTPNELGIFDMSGNVWEFCWDYFDKEYYSNSSEKDPTGPAVGEERVLRGGSWSDDLVFNRVFYRNFYKENSRGSNVGLRIVRK